MARSSDDRRENRTRVRASKRSSQSPNSNARKRRYAHTALRAAGLPPPSLAWGFDADVSFRADLTGVTRCVRVCSIFFDS